MIDDAGRAQLGSMRAKLFYGFGSAAFGLKTAGFSTMLGFYYSQVIGLRPELAGLAVFFALLVDAFVDPVIGHLSDNMTSRWGRRHPFMYASAIPVGIAFYFLWSPPALGQEGLFLYLLGMAIVVRVFISMFEIPNSAMIAEMTTDYDQRTIFLSYRYFFGVLGGAAMGFITNRYFLVPDAAHKFGQLSPSGYPIYGLVGGVALTVIIILSSLGLHRYIKHFRVIAPRRITIVDIFREIFQSLSNASFVVLVSAALCGTIAIGTSSYLTNYFATYFWGLSAKQLSLFSLIALAAAMIGVLVASPMSKAFGKRKLAIALYIVFIFTSSIPIALRLIGFFPANGSPFLLPLLLADRLVSDSLAIVVLIMFSSMLTDVVEDSEIKTKRRSEGLFFAALAFVSKATTGVGALIGGLMLRMVAFPEHANPDTIGTQVLHNLAYVYMPVIVIMFTAGMFLLARYRITRESHGENLRKLEEAAVLAEVPVAVEGELTSGLPEHALGE